MKVSIITPVWGHADVTEQFIQGVATTTDADFELVIVDNASPDNTLQMLEKYAKYPWLKVVKNKVNLGFGGGNNVGYKQSTGELVLFMNNDIVIENPNWLKQLLTTYERNPKSIVGAQMVKGNMFTYVRGKTNDYINGWCMLLSRDLCEKIGGFDENFGLGWFEDVWFSVRTEQLGYKLIEVKVPIRHLGSSTIFDGRLDTNKLMSRAGSYFRYKVIKSQIKEKKMRIVFLCQGNYKFSDGTWEGKGVGGAEASLILLARELAKQGHTVDIYNNPELVGQQNGVNYFPLSDFRYSDYADVCVIFRNVVADIDKINAAFKVFWSCDQYTNADFNTTIFPFVDKVVCISDYHKQYFLKHYILDEKKITVIDLGINIPDYLTACGKRPNRLIYCSVPNRGLDDLLRLFPEIKKRIPTAHLIVTSDYSLWGAQPGNEHLLAKAREIDGVHFLGKVDRKRLVYLQKSSKVMAYPCNYDENFCIAAAECLAAGAVPVVKDIGALKTTVGDAGVFVKNDKEFVDAVVNLLTDQEKTAKLVVEGWERAYTKFNWQTLAQTWEQLFWEGSRQKMINVLEHLSPLKIQDLDVLDLGCGKYDSGVSVQIPFLPFKSLTGVDVYEKDLAIAKGKVFAAGKVEFIQSEILEWLEKNKNKQYDVITLYDVVEHFKKEDALRLLGLIGKMARKRILIFMPMGEHTLEANDGRVKEENNHWQQHLSEWKVDEWKKLGYDVEVLEGFHHGGILDAAWVIKDFMNKKEQLIVCEKCGLEFHSEFFFEKHKIAEDNPLEVKAPTSEANLPPVKIITKRRIQLSINSFSTGDRMVNEIIVPYNQLADITRILMDAYGSDIIASQETVE